MAGNPQENGNKINKVANAWESLRPAKSFAGMTLADFQAAVKPSLDARATITDLENQLQAAEVERDKADKISLAKVQLVVNAVKGDPAEGEDGELYETMGYVRKSARASGLSRKNTQTPPTK